MVEQHGEDYLVWLSGLDCPVLMFRGQLERWPVYVNTQLGMDIPLPEMATPFPVEAAVQLGGREYITNSFSWLLAWAIIGGATHITLTGLAMGKDTLQLWESRNTAAKWLEQGTALSMMGPGKPAPNTQKVINDLKGYGSGDESWLLPNVEYWIGIARGRGIEVTVDPACDHGLFYDKWGGLYGLNAGGNE